MRKIKLEPPFFELGPKNYLYGDQVIDLARITDEAARKYDVRVIYTPPYTSIKEAAEAVRTIKIFAPHMDNLPVGRGLGSVLPEAVKAAGAVGVMLNHAERPLSLSCIESTLQRAREVGLMTIVCADSMAKIRSIAQLSPDLMLTEPTELIGTGQACDLSYVKQSFDAVMEVNSDIGVLVGGGISSGEDVYNTIMAGADATGSSSGVVKAADPGAMVNEMFAALRQAWDDRMAAEGKK